MKTKTKMPDVRATTDEDRTQQTFLFLQGPHGPFFARLADRLTTAGATCLRVGFNAGDRRFWPRGLTFIPWPGTPEAWFDAVAQVLHDNRVTDLVVYNDCRPIHAQAIAAAKRAGITVHVFEEGYLRPFWVTYERGGSNGNSKVMTLTVDQMRIALDALAADPPAAPARWGDLRQHIYYGALYHLHVLALNRAYLGFRTHRRRSVGAEFRQYFRRLLTLPFSALERTWKTAVLRQGGAPYHLVLLQLEHDSSFLSHGPFGTSEEFLSLVIDEFARSAPRHHRLVLKAHPLEDGSAGLPKLTRVLATRHGVRDRVTLVPGGKLAPLLDLARSIVTVNSTAAQQALWRGLPVKAFGQAVYSKPDLVSDQPLGDFFNAPHPPDARAYRDYRRFLLDTSQVPGGFYSAGGRNRLLLRIVDLMLAETDPYSALMDADRSSAPMLRVVK